MDKLDIILQRLDSLDRIESEIKALKADHRETYKKLSKIDGISVMQGLTWRAVQELRDDKTELNELRKRIEILESKLAM
ncbi:hypothetical protein SDC9_23717 [bioreactor metagenome]|uniref:Uncharacterized protein n=2 Tax=root TaxID=1 RepID=A0A098B4S7_DESHA|nr:hypothetical protein [Desulfitobacterium hafniense]MEA5022577.1 hypothetical protein [Desulfitobacterium hafniense]CDX02876.1 Hypothetical protein DPCES_2989 [Desulfitobacterium hafniense]